MVAIRNWYGNSCGRVWAASRVALLGSCAHGEKETKTEVELTNVTLTQLLIHFELLSCTAAAAPSCVHRSWDAGGGKVRGIVRPLGPRSAPCCHHRNHRDRDVIRLHPQLFGTIQLLSPPTQTLPSPRHVCTSGEKSVRETLKDYLYSAQSIQCSGFISVDTL